MAHEDCVRCHGSGSWGWDEDGVWEEDNCDCPLRCDCGPCRLALVESAEAGRYVDAASLRPGDRVHELGVLDRIERGGWPYSYVKGFALAVGRRRDRVVGWPLLSSSRTPFHLVLLDPITSKETSDESHQQVQLDWPDGGSWG
jgi:hypothetical protein